MAVPAFAKSRKAALKQGPDTARGDTIVYNMATDTLSLKGGAKVGAAGKTGNTPPKRKLEDPFADDDQATGPSTGAAVAEKTQAGDDTNDENDDSQAADTQPEPVKKGRSRLIIQPK